MVRSPIILIFLFMACSCTRTSDSPIKNKQNTGVNYRILYSSKLIIDESTEGVKITVKRPFEGAKDYKYFLSGEKPEKLNSDYTYIKTPVSTILPVSTSHLSMIEAIGMQNKIVGFPTVDYITSPSLRQRVEEGHIIDIGSEADFNLEIIAELSPALIMGYAVNSPDEYERLNRFGIKSMFNADYMEMHPLGRAEWIKVFGLLFNRYEQADSVFSQIENNYLKIKGSLPTKKDKPQVISGSLYGDTWFLPGGENYASKLLEDAGYRYVYESDSSRSFLKLSFEAVFDKANDAVFWIGPAPFQDLNALEQSDHRYGYFKAFKEGNVWCYDNSLGEKGGNNYLELGYLRPDIILKDLIVIHSPEVFPDYNPFFYRQLE